MTAERHGEETGVDVALAIETGDYDLARVRSPMSDYLDCPPGTCDALCVCDRDDPET